MSATPAQIKQRFIDLYTLVPGIVTVVGDWPQDNKPFKESELPAIVVQMGRATNTRQSATNFIMSRPYYGVLLAARLPNDDKIPDEETLASVDPFLVSIPRFFMARPRLQLNDSGIVSDTSIVMPSDSGAGRFAFRSATYIRTVFTHQIQTRHSA